MKSPLLLCTIGFTLTIFSCQPNSDTQNASENDAQAQLQTLMVSTYTSPDDEGNEPADSIHTLNMNLETGELTRVASISGVSNPSYFVLHPNGKYMYVVERPSDVEATGYVSSYDISGPEAVQIDSVSSQGTVPCHISIDPTGTYVLVANYMETIASFEIQEDGSLSEALSVVKHQRVLPEEVRQETGHPHMILPALDQQAVFVSDLGADSIFHYQLSDSGTFQLMAQSFSGAKSGPRHMVFHDNGEWCYVVNELDRTVSVFAVNDPLEPFELLQKANTLAEDDERVFPAAIRLHPTGKFLYVSNRGLNGRTLNTIAVFVIDQESGELTLIEEVDTRGAIPRDFNLTPDGSYLLAENRKTNSIFVFTVDQETGKLSETGVSMEVLAPVCIQFL